MRKRKLLVIRVYDFDDNTLLISSTACLSIMIDIYRLFVNHYNQFNIAVYLKGSDNLILFHEGNKE